MEKESHVRKWLKLLCSSTFVMELLVLAVHPLPYVEHQYTNKILNMLSTKDTYVVVNYMLSDFLFAFMFFRFYFLVRTMMNFSVYSEMYAKRICAKHKFEGSTFFCLKALITKSAGKTILITASLSILWLSYLLRIFER